MSAPRSRRAGPAILAVLVLATSCSDTPDPAESAVRGVFTAFGDALRRADTDALCDLLTRESLPALEHLCDRSGATPDAFVVDAIARRSPSRFEVAVRTAIDATPGTFVVVREAGLWWVDLVESAAVTNGTERGAPTIEPSGMTPAEIDGIRANQGLRLQ